MILGMNDARRLGKQASAQLPHCLVQLQHEVDRVKTRASESGQMQLLKPNNVLPIFKATRLVLRPLLVHELPEQQNAAVVI